MTLPESNLNVFDPATRSAALAALLKDGPPQVSSGDHRAPAGAVNVHLHSFYSYNALGYSPTRIAWEAQKRGLEAVGLVDFDVLDGREEFYAAARMLGLRACVGVETRVLVPALADQVINSPGEPGIAYHLGLGFPHATPPGADTGFMSRLRRMAGDRNRSLVGRVNAYLAPVSVDYDADVLPLTPGGHATERHLCLAYARKAAVQYADPSHLASFWRAKLGDGDDFVACLPDGPALLARIRSVTMKQGGAGYVSPGPGAFPELVEMNDAVRSLGALPAVTWLDGRSEGERDPDHLLQVHAEAGAAALNIVPDRNFTRGIRDPRLANLEAIIDHARKRHLPLVCGTEMNAPGQPFVDDFDAPELTPFLDDFRRGAWLVCAHAALQTGEPMGYLSPWAEKHFPSLPDRNRFYEAIGRTFDPGAPRVLHDASPDLSPGEVLTLARRRDPKPG